MNLDRYQDKGLSDLRDHQELQSLCKCVSALPLYIGAPVFRNESDEDDIPIIQLSNFIMKMFPHFTAKMVTDAFDFAAAGKLYEDGKMVKISTYGKQMNIEVLGAVLRTYNQYLEEHKAITRPIIKDQHLLPPVEDVEKMKMKPIDHYNDLLEKIKEEGKLPKFHVYGIIRKHLVSIGELEETKATKRREGSFGSIRQILQSDADKKAIYEYLIKKGILNAN